VTLVVAGAESAAVAEQSGVPKRVVFDAVVAAKRVEPRP
jgi:hypothetical protein